jgi:hypothetical protein
MGGAFLLDAAHFLLGGHWYTWGCGPRLGVAVACRDLSQLLKRNKVNMCVEVVTWSSTVLSYCWGISSLCSFYGAQYPRCAPHTGWHGPWATSIPYFLFSLNDHSWFILLQLYFVYLFWERVSLCSLEQNCIHVKAALLFLWISVSRFELQP